MLITLELLTFDFVEEIWMNFMKMRLNDIGRDFENLKIERVCITASGFCSLYQKSQR